jgi:methionyl-tRNA formyltransferase
VFALPTLGALLRAHEVVAIVTQPDRPAHRGQHLTPSPVKVRAERAGLPVLQPLRLREPGWADRLRALGADVAVVIAFGQILPVDVLAAPARGSINVHASLLPRYRGAAPIAWAIMRGETTTGITTMQMDAGMDTGDMLLARATPIGSEETAGELSDRLAALGADVLIETLATLDTLAPTPQRHEEATLAPRLIKAHGALDWSQPATALANVIRGCNPWPGAHTATPRGMLTIWRARAVTARACAPDAPIAGTVASRDTLPSPATPAAPGTLVATGQAGGVPAIATGDGALLPLEVQAENRRAVSWEEYLRGARLAAGTRLGTS